MKKVIAAVFAIAMATVAYAFTGPLIAPGYNVSGGNTAAPKLVISTTEMPKGWFANKNALDSQKSELTLTLAFGATSCSDAATNVTSSKTKGNFTAVTNSQGTTTGWVWDDNGEIGLSAFQNKYQLVCGVPVGCAQTVSVTGTLAAFTKGGAPHTYDNGAAVSESLSFSIPAFLEAVVTTGCDGGGTDDCIKACQDVCEATYPPGRERGVCNGDCGQDCSPDNP
jgi:YD repeat-containing protein